MKKLRRLFFGYFGDLPNLSEPKPYQTIVVNGRIRFVHSTVGEQVLPINRWYRYIHSKAVQNLYANKFKS